jgi:ceramide glucosyltransferase
MSPGQALSVAAMVVLGLAVCGAVFNLLATAQLWRFLKRPAARALGRPSVTILRPLHGDEPELYENLQSLCGQDYAGLLRIVVGVQEPADPAIAHVQRLQAEQPERDIVLVIDATPHGTNRKLGNLINMSAYRTGEVVVISDSDVRLPPQGLSAIVGALEQPGAGLVHCLYRGRPAAGFWSLLATQDSNTRFMPSVAMGQVLGAHPCLGPTMALRAETLDRIGGFPYLADFLADDFELGRAVRALGLGIACPPLVIDHVFPERSARDMIVHELRWARTVRLVNPGGYAGSVITHFLILALAGAALTGFAGWSTAMLGGLLLVRLLQADAANRVLKADHRMLWLIPLRDVFSFAVFVIAHLGRRVEWRGNRLKVQRDGALSG